MILFTCLFTLLKYMCVLWRIFRFDFFKFCGKKYKVLLRTLIPFSQTSFTTNTYALFNILIIETNGGLFCKLNFSFFNIFIYSGLRLCFRDESPQNHFILTCGLGIIIHHAVHERS